MIYIGTMNNDNITVRNEDNYGLQGDDTFIVSQFSPSSLNMLLSGGTGNDHYVIEDFSTSFLLDAGNSPNDKATINIDFNELTANTVILNNTDLLFIDTAYNFGLEPSMIAILDFDTDKSRIETFNINGQLYNFDNFIAAVKNNVTYINENDDRIRSIVDIAYEASNVLEGTAFIENIPEYDNAVYRFYNTEANRHFYTAGEKERDKVILEMDSFIYEGVAFGYDASQTGENVHRFYNSETGAHFYTISEAEKEAVIANYSNYVYEGVAYQAHATQDAGTHALFRFYNHETNTHFYTDSIAERDNVINSYDTFEFEGVAYYVDDVA